VYAAGRLDAETEGLLFLTNDNVIRHRMMNPRYEHPKTYLAQVERAPDEKALDMLRSGKIFLDGRHVRRAEVTLLSDEPDLLQRPVPIRIRTHVPTAWLRLTLREGRNRQVRRMTAAVGHPTLRLIRVGIGSLTIGGLSPGKWRELTGKEVQRLRIGLGTVA
jgi:23S rRNA pseudouridine2457 synthase